MANDILDDLLEILTKSNRDKAESLKYHREVIKILFDFDFTTFADLFGQFESGEIAYHISEECRLKNYSIHKAALTVYSVFWNAFLNYKQNLIRDGVKIQ